MTATARERDPQEGPASSEIAGAESAPRKPDFTIITGLSGAGRSEAAKALEDVGYFVIDNLPPALISNMAELAAQPETPVEHVAVVVDVRGGLFFPELSETLADLKRRGVEHRIVFLEASDEALIRRFEHTRRKHPLAHRITEGIIRERTLLRSLRGAADLVIDTTELTVHDLRHRIVDAFGMGPREARMQVTVVSFGYKFGIPLDADLVLDVRFLPNPHWVDELRPLPGTDPKVQDYIMSRRATTDFLQRFGEMFDVLVPGYLSEGKRYLTVAIGCTGGRHRSVVVADRTAELLGEHGLPVRVEHRDVERT